MVGDLHRDLPGLRRFATLSPVPGFRSWMAACLASEPGVLLEFLDADQRRALADHSPGQAPGHASGLAPGHAADQGPRERPHEVTDRETTADEVKGLAAIVADPAWPSDPDVVEPLRPVILRLAAHYLTKVRRDGHSADPVAHFHLSNGARVERINWAANRSPLGVQESLGLMVNYAYDPERIEANHMDYRRRGRVVTSSAVGRLAG